MFRRRYGVAIALGRQIVMVRMAFYTRRQAEKCRRLNQHHDQRMRYVLVKRTAFRDWEEA